MTAYDLVNNRTLVTDALGRTTVSAYDALDRLVRVADPAGSVTETVYDAAGNAVRLIDPLGQITDNSYDASTRRQHRTMQPTALGGLYPKVLILSLVLRSWSFVLAKAPGLG